MALCRLGERWGCEFLIYNPLVFVAFQRLARANAPAFADAILELHPGTRRIADVGAGTGRYALEFKRRGLRAYACEYHWFGRLLSRLQGVPCVRFDLRNSAPAKMPGSFDVAYSCEVAEHLPPAMGDELVRFLCRLAPTVVFTAAHPGQGGHGHINCQPKIYWIERFERNGYRFNDRATAQVSNHLAKKKISAVWLVENIGVYERVHDGPSQS
jgi:SAM-dependent methyltransferase